jgi:hypothetical protein
MNTVMFDPRYVESVALDPETLNPTTELVSTRRSRRPLVCGWQRTVEGRLTRTWRQSGPDEAEDPPWGHSRATPDMKNANETRKTNRRSEMTPRRPRAIEIEAYTLSTIAGATDAQLPLPSQTPNRAQAVAHWIAIALLLAGAGLELVLCFSVGSSDLL